MRNYNTFQTAPKRQRATRLREIRVSRGTVEREPSEGADVADLRNVVVNWGATGRTPGFPLFQFRGEIRSER